MKSARFVVLLFATACASALVIRQDPFSFDDVHAGQLPTARYAKAADGTRLAYFPFESADPAAILLFIHGGGAHSGAGYHRLATQLSAGGQFSVYLVDLRGHGQSDGRRGYCPEPDTLFADLNAILSAVRSSAKDVPFFLGGHSSGAGLLLNYASSDEHSPPHGYLFVAPELGFRSNTARESSRPPFAEAHIAVFLASEFSGRNLCGGCTAVTFNYPGRILAEDPLLLSAISTNMAYALTPTTPQEQFRNLDASVAIVIGENDELIDPAKLAPYLSVLPDSLAAASSFVSVPGATHLSILNNSADSLARAMHRRLENHADP